MNFSEILNEALAIDQVNTTPGKEKVVVLIGRLQPPTKAHIKIIEDGMKNENMGGVIGVIKSDNKNSPFPVSLISKMLKTVNPKIEVLSLTSGFIGDFISELRDKDKEPVILYAGSDRVNSYKGQLKRYSEKLNLSLNIVEITITDEDISASKVREAILNDDIKTFKKMMDPKLVKYFEEMKGFLT